MDKLIFRAKSEPTRRGLSWDEKWLGDDRGLIKCWETGRESRATNPELARKAKMNELPVIGWKGGVKEVSGNKEKFGSFYYLAEWQGLRGDGLKINPQEEVKITCSRTGMTVTFTPDKSKY